MSSNLHRNSTEANKHTPKGFDLADNNTTLLRDERGQSRYIDNLVNERVENLVDGFNAPPTTTSGHLYVLIDNGSGTVNTNWQGANYDDIVRIQDGVWVAITPVNGYLVFNKTDEKYYKFGSLGWQKLINIVEDTTPQLGGDLDLNGNDINGTGNVDITGNVIADIVQLRGGVGTQGEMSWNTDEETVQLVMDGTTLHIGQDTLVVVRNNTASIITKGTAVYATGTLGASGKITVAPMIANGTIPARLFIGLAAEDIAIGADGQVMTFGKIRQINTSAFNDGDVLWLSPTVAGQLTATEPTAPNLKIATAFVIHDATNGTLMVRAEQGNDLHLDQRVQVSGLTNNDVLTWNNVNQRWQNAQPVLPNWGSIGGTLSAQTDLQNALNAKENSITAGTTGQYWRGDKTFQTLDKTAVGLGNVDNTTDANKPISTATQTALNAKQDTLVSGTNIKTLNSESLLGSGNIVLNPNAYYDDVNPTPLTARGKLRALEYIEMVDNPTTQETEIQLRADSLLDAETTRFGENGSGNVDLKIEENKLLTGNVSGFATEYTATAECVIGLDANNEILEFETIEIYNILKEDGITANKTLALTDIAGASANVKAKFEISAIVVQNTTANAVTINIGSTALGTDVVNAYALGASETKKLPLSTTFFSITSGQNLFISSGSWNSANINIHVTISKIWQ